MPELIERDGKQFLRSYHEEEVDLERMEKQKEMLEQEIADVQVKIDAMKAP